MSKKDRCNADVRKSPRTGYWTHCVKDKDHTDDHVDRWGNHRKRKQPPDRTARKEAEVRDRFKRRWRRWRQRRELRLTKKAEAPGLYRLMLEGIQPIDWLLDEGRISQAAYTLALDWLKKGYLCQRKRPKTAMFEHQGYDFWLELTIMGRRRLKRRYGDA